MSPFLIIIGTVAIAAVLEGVATPKTEELFSAPAASLAMWDFAVPVLILYASGQKSMDKRTKRDV
jgi:hypothetical protein